MNDLTFDTGMSANPEFGLRVAREAPSQVKYKPTTCEGNRLCDAKLRPEIGSVFFIA